jgi:hypothetical protein
MMDAESLLKYKVRVNSTCAWQREKLALCFITVAWVMRTKAKMLTSPLGLLPGQLTATSKELSTQYKLNRKAYTKLWQKQCIVSATMTPGGMNPPGPGCDFHVKALKGAPVTYAISLAKVEQFARRGTARGPQDIIRKNRMRELLGLER